MNENDYTILPCPCCGAKAEFQQLGDEDGAQRVEEAPEPLAQYQTAALDRDAELQDLRERCEYLQKERDLYHDALIARHGGEPVMLLHEFDWDAMVCGHGGRR